MPHSSRGGCDSPLLFTPSGRCWVVGGSALDEVLRIPVLPAPGGWATVTATHLRVGGTAPNAAVALASAGVDVRLVSWVGDDDAGRRIRSEVAARHVDVAHVREGEGPSTHLILLVDDDGERTIIQRTKLRLDKTPTPDSADIRRGDTIYVASWPGELTSWLSTPDGVETLLLAVPDRAGDPVACDALICSANEVGRDLDALRGFLDPRGPVRQAVILTDGARGASVVTDTDEATIAAPPVPVVDTTGAGDAFAAGVIRHLMTGGTWRGAVREGVLWGAAAVQVASSFPPPWRAEFDPRSAGEGVENGG